MGKTLTELLADYKDNVERALAGHMTGKKDKDLSHDDVKKAEDVTKKLELDDYHELVNALDTPEQDAEFHHNDSDDDGVDEDIIDELLNKYGFEHTENGEDVDKDLLVKEGFNYYGVFEDEAIRTKVTKYLDENEIEYMEDGAGSIHMKFNSRDRLYKAESEVNRIIRSNNPRYVRDSVLESRASEMSTQELKRIIDQYDRDGRDAPPDIVGEYEKRKKVNEAKKVKKPASRNPIVVAHAKKGGAGAGPHGGRAKYNKVDRLKAKKDLKDEVS